jgi:hypothetical protein
VNGETQETFVCYKYKDPMFENYGNKDSLVVRDPLYKGFFPMFINFTLFTEEDIDALAARSKIVEYLDSISGSIDSISLHDLQTYLKSNGFNVVVSSSNSAYLFPSAGKKVTFDVVFPLTMRDISIPAEIMTPQISERTIRIFAGDLNVVKE